MIVRVTMNFEGLLHIQVPVPIPDIIPPIFVVIIVTLLLKRNQQQRGFLIPPFLLLRLIIIINIITTTTNRTNGSIWMIPLWNPSQNNKCSTKRVMSTFCFIHGKLSPYYRSKQQKTTRRSRLRIVVPLAQNRRRCRHNRTCPLKTTMHYKETA